MKVRITFIEPLLGTASNNPEVHAEFIASKAPDAMSKEEEIASIGTDAEIEKSMTVFPKDAEGNPILFDYQVKGFCKESCQFMRQVSGSKSSKLTAFKKKIDGLLFIEERQISLHLPEGGVIGNLQRPLRAQTAQGERICLANSETVPAGTWFECEFFTYEPKIFTDEIIKEWLDYGKRHGIGQWRNASYGIFKYEVIG